MKLYMYSICDKYTSYIFPFPAYSDQAAIRNFAAEMNNNPVGKDNPQDFELFKVGSFDSETGKIEVIYPHVPVTTGLNVVRKE